MATEIISYFKKSSVSERRPFPLHELWPSCHDLYAGAKIVNGYAASKNCCHHEDFPCKSTVTE